VGVAIAARELNETQPVAVRVEPHCLGVDGDRVAEQQPFRQVALVQLIAHAGSPRGALPAAQFRRAPLSDFIKQL
jgi:hypothetical protein